MLYYGRDMTVRLLLMAEIRAFLENNGECYDDNPDYWVNTFGMDEDGIVKAFSFYDSEDGCWYTEEVIHDDKEQTLDRFETNVVMTLYTKRDGTIWCYMLSNQGIVYDSDKAEPYHLLCEELTTQGILEIYYALRKVNINNN